MTSPVAFCDIISKYGNYALIAYRLFIRQNEKTENMKLLKQQKQKFVESEMNDDSKKFWNQALVYKAFYVTGTMLQI